MNKNWFFIFILSIAALGLAGTAAWFSIFGLTQLFYGAGVGITILAASLEFAKVVTVSYVYRFWKHIEKGLRGFYIFAVVFIMFLTSMGIYGFLASGYQKSANKIELRDSQIKISNSKKTLFVNQLDRLNKSIESSSQRINTISGLRTQQEKRLDNLYNQKYMTVAKRTEGQITGSDEQIKLLNDDITLKMKQTNVVNDSIAFYDQKIADLKASDVTNEVSSYQFISDLTGIAMNKVVNFVALIIIFVFDPLAIALLIAVNRLTMNKEDIPDEKSVNKIKEFFRRKKKNENEEEEPKPEVVEPESVPVPDPEPIKRTSLFTRLFTKDEDELEENEYSEVNEEHSEPKKKETLFENCPDGYQEEKIDLNISNIKEGLRVFHNTFGNGVITKFNADKTVVFINFEGVGTKELSSEYANLKERICVETITHLDFAENNPEIQDIHVKKPEEENPEKIIEEDEPNIQDVKRPFVEEENPINEVEEQTPIEPEKIIELDVEKKKKLFQKIWRGKKII